MKKHLLLYACCLAAATATAASRTATEAFVTNRITIATNALHQSIAPSIDYSTNNVELTNTIAKVAPSPGNYVVVSNNAMQISMPGDDGHPPMIYDPYFKGTASHADGADYLELRQSEYALTLYNGRWGMRYGYPSFGYQYLPFAYLSDIVDATNGLFSASGGTITGSVWLNSALKFRYGYFDGPTVYAYTPGVLAFGSGHSDYANRYAILDLDRLSEYETAEIAFLHEVPTSEDITAAIREQSLGGIWDEQLGVWWTPVMSNGKLTYQATTNVNMSAETNP